MDVLYGEHPRAFWTNLHDNTLVSMPVPATHEQETSRSRRETSPMTTVLKDLKKPRGVAVDWVTGLVYVVNAGDRTILAVSLDGSKKATLISTDLEQTHDIVVDPQSGQLFWTDWGFSPGIDVAYMDGQNKKRLVYRDVQGPVGLAIDYPTQRLYWADIKTNKIETVKLDGSDRHLVKHFAPGEGLPSNLDVFEDMIYLITQDTNTVYRLNKFGYRSQDMVRISQHPIKISDLVIVQEQKQDSSLFNPCASNPCDSDAMCLISGPKNYSCICPDGMTKDTVAGVVKCHNQPAKENSCPLFCNKGECVQTSDGPRCQCHPKYHGQNCEKYRCSGYCRNNGYCSIDLKSENTTGVPSLKCFCGPKWTGERCETPLKICDNFCQNGGVCNTDENSTYCICPRKFTGERCEHCEELRCENGGTCRTRLINDETVPFCSCAEGYHGVTCTHSVCANYCKHGTCRILQGRPHCTCSSGWSGRTCETCIDEAACENLCTDFICANEGKCIIIPGPPRQTHCLCAPGYQGQQCEISICDNYCNNGLCKIRMGTPICECDRGWSGPRCSERTCQEGASCGCPPGYHGQYCNNSVCTNYCQQGECQLDDGDPFCKCPLGFSGDRCEHNDCDHFCHRGTCRITADGAVCDCEEGYTGQQCMEPLPSSDSCLSNDCENGGTCYIENDKRMCRCPQEYKGAKCEKPVAAEDNPCDLNCLHGGICQVRYGSPVCVCTHGWTGMNCGLQTICEESSCFNGGTCKPNADPSLPPTCICPEGYTGYRCGTPENFRAEKVETSSPNTATVIIGVFIAVVVLVVAVVVVWLWQRQRGKGISHVRLEENGGTVEMTNPMYLHASDDQEDDPNPVFTLHDSPNTFKNPVYDSLYSAEAAASITQEEKTGLLQLDPLGALDTSRPNGSKS